MMLDFIFNKRSVTGKCYFLYFPFFDTKKNRDFFQHFRKYLEGKYGVSFSYIDFHDEMYKMNYLKLETDLKKIEGRFEEQIHLALYDGDFKKKGKRV